MDTSSVISGYVPTASTAHYTVPEVVEEARGLAAAGLVGAFIESGRLRVWDSSAESVRLVRGRLARIGGELSETDIKLIALAVDLRGAGLYPVILTDDYGLQNMCKVLGIGYRSIGTRGIASVYEWKMTCPACERDFSQGVFCPVCGTKLRKVVARKLG